MPNIDTTLAILLIHGISSIRSLALQPKFLSFKGAHWDRVKSPEILDSFSGLKRVVKLLDVSLDADKVLQAQEDIDMIASKILQLHGGTNLEALLAIVDQATALPLSTNDSQDAVNWRVALAKFREFSSVGMQYLLERADYGLFKHTRILNLGEVKRLSTSTPPTLPAMFEAWSVARNISDLRESRLVSFAGSESVRSMPERRLISRLSDTFIIHVGQAIKTDGIEWVDFGPWTSFHPVPMRLQKSNATDVEKYGMWEWKEGTSILDFHVFYDLVGCVMNGETDSLWLRSTMPNAEHKLGDWVVYSSDGDRVQRRKHCRCSAIEMESSNKEFEMIEYLVYRKAAEPKPASDISTPTGTMSPSGSDLNFTC
ncbi:Fc.00g059530.m01.CDS01 [Cosmosporella sp. VM-42]